MVKRTKHRIIFPAWKLEKETLLTRKSLPDNMEVATDDYPWGPYIATYLTDEEFLKQQDVLFPICPVTGITGVWDHDWAEAFELF